MEAKEVEVEQGEEGEEVEAEQEEEGNVDRLQEHQGGLGLADTKHTDSGGEQQMLEEDLAWDLSKMNLLPSSPAVQELYQLLPQLLLPCSHPPLLRVLQDLPSPHLDTLARHLARNTLALAATQSGSSLLGAALSLLPPPLSVPILSSFSSLNSLEDLRPLLSSSSILMIALPLLPAPDLQHLLCLVTPRLEQLLQHPSVELLLQRVAAVCPGSLLEVARHLEREGSLLSPGVRQVTRLLLGTKSPHICGVFLHHLSGRLQLHLKVSCC